MLRIFRSRSNRCAMIGCGLLAGSLALQGLSSLMWVEPARTRSLLEFIYGARGALLQALNVMALALVTVGVLRSRLAVSAAICAAWALSASIEMRPPTGVPGGSPFRLSAAAPLPPLA